MIDLLVPTIAQGLLWAIMALVFILHLEYWILRI
jgi:hypothetical protein